jgi:hypothetical protein
MLNQPTIANKENISSILSMHKPLRAYKTPITNGRRKWIDESLEQVMRQVTT